jgi:hypothetical protein
MPEDTTKSSPLHVRRRWMDFSVNALLVLGSLCAVFLLTEVALRIAGVGSDQFLRPDAVLGVRFIASKSGLSQDKCFKGRISVNSHGWRDRERSLTKPEGVYRVLVLGDSFMAGMQVDNDEIFASVLEDRLARMGMPRRVEVINLGVPSYGTDQELLSLREFGIAYQPDLVLLAFYGQNDISDNYSVLISAKSVYAKPFFDVEHDSLIFMPITKTTPWPIRIARELAAHSRLYPLVRDTAVAYPPTLRILYRLGVVGIVPQDDRPTDDSVAVPPWPWPNRWRRQLGVYEVETEWVHRVHAWEITDRLLNELKVQSEQAGAKFLLVELAAPIAVMPPPVRGGLVANLSGVIVDPDKPSRRLTEIAGRRQIDLISTVPGFRSAIGDSESEFGKYYLSCDGHWTAAGHRLAADLVAPEVAARIAPAPR